jgi:hypothetical protein
VDSIGTVRPPEVPAQEQEPERDAEHADHRENPTGTEQDQLRQRHPGQQQSSPGDRASGKYERT